MADCFISYRRTPSAPVAIVLQSKLESKYGFDVYLDTTRTDSTHVRFPERLMRAIADAPVFICLLGERDGQHTLESDWVLKEIQQAYDLRKFCIPVFQESYRPLPDTPPAVDYLLGFDGVHILDQKNIMIDESVRQMADLIRPHRKRRRTPLLIGAGALFVLFVLGVFLILANWDDFSSTPDPPSTTAVAQAAPETLTAESGVSAPLATDDSTDTPAPEPTMTETAQPTRTDTPTPSNTPDIIAAARLVLEQQTAQAIIDNSTATAARATLDFELQQTESANLTATATRWTATPTPNLTASVEAVLTHWANETATQAAVDRTATATLWTATPTATFTPTLSPEQRALTPVAHNADWTPVERDFDGVTMVLVPAGCFMMGSDESQDDEQPVHEQCFEEPFWIDKYEVTQAQFARLGGQKANPNHSTGDNRPVERITWFEARDFCVLRGARLPTEVEWEYAARGPDSLVYPWGNAWNANNVVWLRNSNNQTAAVGSIPAGASWVRALDMSGNVWEWTSSLYEPYPYDASDGREADTGNRADVRRVLRGGSFLNAIANLRGAIRYRYIPNSGNNIRGFRCARSV